jgi:hypothetical protein
MQDVIDAGQMTTAHFSQQLGEEQQCINSCWYLCLFANILSVVGNNAPSLLIELALFFPINRQNRIT